MELDQIKIEGLEIFANHGVFPEENVLGQKFIVSATLYTDTRKAGKTDELTASIHYGEVSAFITEFIKSHTYKLLERVAEELVEDMLQKFDGLEKVTLEIQKPWAPVGLPLKLSASESQEAGTRLTLPSDLIWETADKSWTMQCQQLTRFLQAKWKKSPDLLQPHRTV